MQLSHGASHHHLKTEVYLTKGFESGGVTSYSCEAGVPEPF
jgi:hypothetical protein